MTNYGMNKENKYNQDLAIIVSSCDDNLDVFKEFMKYFKLNWSDCPFKLILVTQTQKYNDENVVSVTTTVDTKWVDRIIEGMKYTEAKYIFTMCEDAFFLEPIKTDYVLQVIEFIKNNDIKYYCNPKHPAKKTKSNSFDSFPGALKIRKDVPYGVTSFTNIWERNEFANLFGGKDWTGWDIENYFLKMASSSEYGYYEDYVTDKDNFLNVVETVNRGKWTYETYMFEKKGIAIDKGNREDAPKSEYYKKKFHIFLNHLVPTKWRKAIKKIFSKLGYKFVTEY